MASEKVVENPSLITQGRTYLSEAVDEIKKVSTPTRQETVQATLVTIVIMLFIAFCLFILDLIFSNLMKALTA